MAKFSHPSSYDYFQQSPALDSKPIFPQDDDMSVLDDKILDSNAQDVTSLSGRRSSFDQSTSDDFSRRESVWSDMTQSRQPSQMSTPLFEAVSNPFGHASTFHPPQWTLTSDSNSCTPTPVYEHFSPDFDGASNPFAGGAVGPVQPLSYPSMPYRPGASFARPPHAVPMSPQSSQGWASASAEPAEMHSKPQRKNSTPAANYRNGSNLHIRRDGIRKKNARFDIPAERTLSNIDVLISRSTDEEEIKELKQQKRLLRNRQAALDSRQRKKVHTEQLEEDKRRSSTLIEGLQKAIQEMKLRETELVREKTELLDSQRQLHQYIDQLHNEKEELIRSHTLETGELRKKNNILREHMDKLEQAAPPPPPSLFRSDFEYDPLGGSSWDDFPMTEYMDTEPRVSVRMPTPIPEKSLTTIIGKTDKVVEKLSSQTDFPFSWNAFYMCLLFGAFIASNGSSMSSSIPPLSEEYRAESANVLKAVLASANPPPTHSLSLATVSNPTPTSFPGTISRAEMAQITPSHDTTMTSLDDLHRTLVAPTKEQEDQQAFALTTEQYTALTTLEDDGDVTPQPSNLQQAYAAMRSNSAATKGMSEVYSRSLMWDRVPDKVVRDFRRMVKDCGIADKHDESGGAMSTS